MSPIMFPAPIRTPTPGRPHEARRAPGLAAAVAAVLVCVSALLSGCSGSGSSEVADPGNEPGTEDSAPPLDDVVDEIQTFWAGALDQAYGVKYDPLPADRVAAITKDGEGPVCDGEPIAHDDDIDDNAYATSCDEGLVVVWDGEHLMSNLEDTFGPVGPAVLLAHEWGHVAQFEAEVDPPGVVAEQQADCFAGAWVAWASKRPDPVLTPDDLDAAVGALLDLADDPLDLGDDPLAEGEDAHGLGFDRVRAFQEGWTAGVKRCAEYPDISLPLIEGGFESAGLGTTAGSGNDNPPPDVEEGDWSLDDLLTLVEPALTLHFQPDAPPGFVEAETDDACELDLVVNGACGGDVHLDTERIDTMLNELGDGAPLATIALAYADAVTPRDDRPEEGRSLLLSCRVGGWLRAVADGSLALDEQDSLLIAPGDLDEALQGYVTLAYDEGVTAMAGPGAVFEAVAALRLGFTDGDGACR